jgi:hypothetical protein
VLFDVLDKEAKKAVGVFAHDSCSLFPVVFGVFKAGLQLDRL